MFPSDGRSHAKWIAWLEGSRSSIRVFPLESRSKRAAISVPVAKLTLKRATTGSFPQTTMPDGWQ